MCMCVKRTSLHFWNDVWFKQRESEWGTSRVRPGARGSMLTALQQALKDTSSFTLLQLPCPSGWPRKCSLAFGGPMLLALCSLCEDCLGNLFPWNWKESALEHNICQKRWWAECECLSSSVCVVWSPPVERRPWKAALSTPEGFLPALDLLSARHLFRALLHLAPSTTAITGDAGQRYFTKLMENAATYAKHS